MGIDKETLAQVSMHLRPLATRVANTVARAVIQLVNDSKKMQLVQLGVLAGEDVEGAGGAEHFQPYGFFSVPFPGAEAVVIFPNGDRSHPLVVAVCDRRYRATGGEPGEAGLRTDEGDEIRLARGHAIVLTTSGQVQLGSSSASQGAVKGTQRNTAEQTFLTALSTYVTAIKAVADPSNAATPAMLSAISAFASAVASAVSTKVKLE